MKQVNGMKLYSMKEVLDEIVGPVGTEDRTAFDRDVEADIQAWRVGALLTSESGKQKQAEI